MQVQYTSDVKTDIFMLCIKQKIKKRLDYVWCELRLAIDIAQTTVSINFRVLIGSTVFSLTRFEKLIA